MIFYFCFPFNQNTMFLPYLRRRLLVLSCLNYCNFYIFLPNGVNYVFRFGKSCYKNNSIRGPWLFVLYPFNSFINTDTHTHTQ